MQSRVFQSCKRCRTSLAASPVLKLACGWGLAAACPTVWPSAAMSNLPWDIWGAHSACHMTARLHST